MLLRNVTKDLSKKKLIKREQSKEVLRNENEEAYRQKMISSFRKPISTNKIFEKAREQLDLFQ